jgi:hypothetical protein
MLAALEINRHITGPAYLVLGPNYDETRARRKPAETLRQSPFTYIPDANANGSDSFTITVSDGTIDTVETVNISITGVNDDPVIGSTAIISANEDIAYSYTLSASDVDVGDTLTLSSPTLPSWLNFDASTGVLSGTPTNENVGNHDVTLRVNDGTVDALQKFTINVTNTYDVTNDKSLIIVIDDFSHRVHDYEITTLYDFGTLEVVTYFDNLYDIKTGAYSGYLTYDDFFVDHSDSIGGFYKDTPDENSTNDLDLDFIDSQTFTDINGYTAYADSFFSFSKKDQSDESSPKHGDWVVECSALEL